jgi:hypothetical protein
VDSDVSDRVTSNTLHSSRTTGNRQNNATVKDIYVPYNPDTYQSMHKAILEFGTPMLLVHSLIPWSRFIPEKPGFQSAVPGTRRQNVLPHLKGGTH